MKGGPVWSARSRNWPALTLAFGLIVTVQVVAPILSVLLVRGALSAQFSAAVADTSGSGGLMAESTRRRITPEHGHAIMVALGLILTWTSNAFEIISYASRAFALYYALQAALAALAAPADRTSRRGAGLFLAGGSGLADHGVRNACRVTGRPAPGCLQGASTRINPSHHLRVLTGPVSRGTAT